MKRRLVAKGITTTIERPVKITKLRLKSSRVVRINNEDGC